MPPTRPTPGSVHASLMIRMMVRPVSIAFVLVALISCIMQPPAQAATADAVVGIPAQVVADIREGRLDAAGGWDYAAFDVALQRAHFARYSEVMAIDVPSMTVKTHLVQGQHTHQVLILPGG